jgi:hypothetical protein
MTTLKLNKFLGEAPKLADELLPDTVATAAINCKIYSGNLIPFPIPVNTDLVTKAGTIKTIYPMDNGSGGYDWLHWTTKVDVAQSLLENDTTQRIYFTGDGAPKQTNYTLATSGSDYPTTTRPLGITVPTAVCTNTTTTIDGSGGASLASTDRERTDNIATITLASAPNFGVGAVVTTTLFGGTGYNLTNVAVTAISGSTFSFNSPGSDEVKTADTAGRIAYGGIPLLRNYVYTWYTDWDEESQPSPASTDISAYDGQQCNIATLPTTAPSGYAGIVDAKRLYRSVSSPSGAFYAFVAEIPLATATYTDTLSDLALGAVLESEDYDIPNSSMEGIVTGVNGMLAGFFGNQLCFSEPYKPWAWPIKYRQTINADIMGLAAINTAIVVVTEKSPSMAIGIHPDVVSVTRLDVNRPCVSKESVVNMGVGVTYAAPDGLIHISTNGFDLITKLVHYRDTWREIVVPENVNGVYYNNKYFGSYATGGFIFEQDEKTGGNYTQVTPVFTAAYYNFDDGFMYYIDTTNTKTIKRWDDPDSAAGTFEWKSKLYRLPKPINLGAARILADYAVDLDSIVAENALRASRNSAKADFDGALGRHSVGTYALASGTEEQALEVPTEVTFELWIDGAVKFSKTVGNNEIFRLPMGYKADNAQIRLSSGLRVREVHLGETPTGLEKI